MKTAFLFPGQGAQKTGMGKDMYENVSSYKDTFDMIDKSLDFSLQDACFDGVGMDKSECVQPAIFAHSISMFHALDKNADIYAGLSLGEYSALCANGMIKISECANLVNKRGNIMDNAIEKGTCGMLSVIGQDIDYVESFISEYDDVWVANHLSEKQIAISGKIDSIESISKELTAINIRNIPLNVSGPFHTGLLEDASNKFLGLLQNTDIIQGDGIIYSNYTAKPYPSVDDAPHLLAKQMCSRVKWHECIETMIESGVTEFVEIGPGMVLSKMLKRRLKGTDIKVTSIRDFTSFTKYTNNDKG